MPEPLILGPDDRPDPLAIAGFSITVLADSGRGGGEIISMTSKGNTSAMYAEFARESSWENPDRSRFVELAERHGQIVASPPAPDDAAPDA